MTIDQLNEFINRGYAVVLLVVILFVLMLILIDKKKLVKGKHK